MMINLTYLHVGRL